MEFGFFGFRCGFGLRRRGSGEGEDNGYLVCSMAVRFSRTHV